MAAPPNNGKGPNDSIFGWEQIDQPAPGTEPTSDITEGSVTTPPNKAEKEGISNLRWIVTRSMGAGVLVGVGTGMLPIAFIVAGIVGIPAVVASIADTALQATTGRNVVGFNENIVKPLRKIEGEVAGVAGSALGALGDGLKYAKDNTFKAIGWVVKTAVTDRIASFFANKWEALGTTGLLAGIAYGIGKPELANFIMGTAVISKAIDAMLPTAIQPVNMFLRNVVGEVVHAIGHEGRTVLEKEREGRDPRLMPRRRDDLDKAVKSYLGKRFMHFELSPEDMEDITRLVGEKIADIIAKSDLTEYQKLIEFNRILRNDIKGRDGLINGVFRDQQAERERALEQEREAERGRAEAERARAEELLTRREAVEAGRAEIGITRVVQERIRDMLVLAFTPPHLLEVTTENAVTDLETKVRRAGAEGPGVIKNYLEVVLPQFVRTRNPIAVVTLPLAQPNPAPLVPDRIGPTVAAEAPANPALAIATRPRTLPMTFNPNTQRVLGDKGKLTPEATNALIHALDLGTRDIGRVVTDREFVAMRDRLIGFVEQEDAKLQRPKVFAEFLDQVKKPDNMKDIDKFENTLRKIIRLPKPGRDGGNADRVLG